MLKNPPLIFLFPEVLLVETLRIVPTTTAGLFKFDDPILPHEHPLISVIPPILTSRRTEPNHTVQSCYSPHWQSLQASARTRGRPERIDYQRETQTKTSTSPTTAGRTSTSWEDSPQAGHHGDIPLIVNPFDDLTSVAEAVGLPAALKTFGDIFSTLRSAGKINNKADSVSSDALDKATQLVYAFKETSTHIEYADHQDVYREDTLTMYLIPSGPDNSWIATGEQTIVRSNYGTLWQQDLSSGSQRWPVAS